MPADDSPATAARRFHDTDELFNEAQERIAQMLIRGEAPNRPCHDVNALYVAALRELAQEWQSSDLMDAAAWLEGSL